MSDLVGNPVDRFSRVAALINVRSAAVLGHQLNLINFGMHRVSF